MGNHSSSNQIFGLNLIIENVVLFFFRSFIYLICAFEEADWNIFLAENHTNDTIIDNTCWNIYELSLFSKPNK